MASDLAVLYAGCSRVLQVATLIIPGYGAPIIPDVSTLVLKGEGKRFFPIANVIAHARQ
ncbi:MAG TPA: hypothetical protein VFU88_12375 [Ktedonobacterales bacterium]|nr:hypothetical protein [Ktedonobacterales bacterium]